MRNPLRAKPAAQAGGAPSAGDNPYLNAQNVWLERYGHFVQQAYNWRLIAMLEAVALVVGIAGIIWLGGQSKFVPYVVAIDKIGQPISVRIADKASRVDERVVHAELANWIVDARSVVTDRIVEKANIDAVYAMLQQGAAARGYLDGWYPAAGHSPFARAHKETVAVAIDAILAVSNQTYVVQWTEVVRDLRGNTTSTEHWEASISVAFTQATDEASVLRNPIGLYITSLNWTEKS